MSKLKDIELATTYGGHKAEDIHTVIDIKRTISNIENKMPVTITFFEALLPNEKEQTRRYYTVKGNKSGKYYLFQSPTTLDNVIKRLLTGKVYKYEGWGTEGKKLLMDAISKLDSFLEIKSVWDLVPGQLVKTRGGDVYTVHNRYNGQKKYLVNSEGDILNLSSYKKFAHKTLTDLDVVRVYDISRDGGPVFETSGRRNITISAPKKEVEVKEMIKISVKGIDLEVPWDTLEDIIREK